MSCAPFIAASLQRIAVANSIKCTTSISGDARALCGNALMSNVCKWRTNAEMEQVFDGLKVPLVLDVLNASEFRLKCSLACARTWHIWQNKILILNYPRSAQSTCNYEFNLNFKLKTWKLEIWSHSIWLYSCTPTAAQHSVDYKVRMSRALDCLSGIVYIYVRQRRAANTATVSNDFFMMLSYPVFGAPYNLLS